MRKQALRLTALLLGAAVLTSSSYRGTEKEASDWVYGNSIYYTLGTTVSDPNFQKQWAYQNDGTFTPANELDDFPVFEDPFEDPVNGWDFGSIDYEDLFDWMDEWMSGEDEWFRRIFASSITRLAGNFSVLPKAAEGIDIRMPQAWEAYQGGKREVIVAVIDTGVDYTHEDLAASIWKNEDEIPDDGIDNDGNGFIDDVYGWNFYDNNNQVFAGEEDSHGTHGAGTIAALRNDLGVAGIAGNTTVRVMVVKALGGKDGAGSTDAIIEAIRYAEANGASICNLSFGTTENNRRLRQVMAQSNMLFVAAAGNGDDWIGNGQNSDRRPVYPAAYDLDNIISVANLNIDGTLHSSSNYGSASVDLAAPGSYILSTTPGNTYSYMSGTSMAAPMVTGIAALLYSQYEDITLSEVREILLASVRPLESLNGITVTGGMLDAYAALTYDRTLLPEKENEQTEQQTGTAPEFWFQMAYDFPAKFLIVNIWDAEQDLAAVRYEAGEKDAGYFEKGKRGNEILPNEAGTVTFQVKYGGIYTFYAVDSQGNEIVKIVNVRR